MHNSSPETDRRLQEVGEVLDASGELAKLAAEDKVDIFKEQVHRQRLL